MAKKKAAVSSEVPLIALVDANVFFGPRLRDIFMHLREDELINIHWTVEIEREWVRNVVGKQHASQGDIDECTEGMHKAAPDWRIDGYQKHADQFEMVDAKDRHVAAAALKLSLDDWPGQTVVLVTKNIKDFPQGAFKGTQVTVLTPGEYLDRLYERAPERVVKVITGCRKKLKNPPLGEEAYVAVLVKHGCLKLAEVFASEWNVECPVVAKDGTLFYKSDMKIEVTAKGGSGKKREK